MLKKMVKKPLYLSAALLIFLSFFSFISAHGQLPLFFSRLAWSLVITYLGLLIFRQGVISKYRSILFVVPAIFFLIEFKLLNSFSASKVVPPYCHIALAPTLLNFLHSQILAITSGDWMVWGALSLGFLWLLIMFTIGQGICSWVCFYGGLDEAFSNVRKKPVLKININKKWRDFPLAFLIFLLIVSFLQGLPVFCTWFCPFKLTEKFWDTQASIRIIQITFFYILLFLFVAILPILTKKRTFCSLICPFGALVSICAKASPYKIGIKKEKCILCGKCQEICPVFAVEDTEKKEFHITSYCNKCGKCMDVCPTNAIAIAVGSGIEKVGNIQVRDIYIFISLLMAGVISGNFVPQVILQLMGVK